MPVPTDPYNFTNGTPADAEQVDARFALLYAALNGALDASNMALPQGLFYAYRGTALSLTTGTIVFDAERFDLSAWHDISTGRFTPQVAGYYRLDWLVTLTGVTANDFSTRLRKNGADHVSGSRGEPGGSGVPTSGGSAVVQANGSTDYFTVHFSAFTSLGLASSADATHFCGHLIGRS